MYILQFINLNFQKLFLEINSLYERYLYQDNQHQDKQASKHRDQQAKG